MKLEELERATRSHKINYNGFKKFSLLQESNTLFARDIFNFMVDKDNDMDGSVVGTHERGFDKKDWQRKATGVIQAWKPSLKWRLEKTWFGSKRILGTLTVIFVLNILVQLYWFIEDYKESTIIANMMELYNNTVDYWNTHSVIFLLMTELAVRGTDFRLMDRMALDVLEEYNTKFKDKIIQKYMDLRNVNLGNYTEPYKELTTDANLCTILAKNNPKRYRYCGKGSSGYLMNNLIISMKGMFVTGESYAGRFRRQGAIGIRGLTDEEFKHLIAFGLQNGINSEIYYTIMIPLSKHVEGYIWKNAEKINGATVIMDQDTPFYLKLSIPIYLILIIASYSCFLRQVSKRNEEFKSILHVAPFEKLLKNRPVSEFLKTG